MNYFGDLITKVSVEQEEKRVHTQKEMKIKNNGEIEPLSINEAFR